MNRHFNMARDKDGMFPDVLWMSENYSSGQTQGYSVGFGRQDMPVVIDIPFSEKESANERKKKKYAAKTRPAGMRRVVARLFSSVPTGATAATDG